jgi:3-deoxy-D-manno-octulosonic-acid transferase
MSTRFWFVVYNLFILNLLSGAVKILAPFRRNIRDGLEKREGLWERLESSVSKRDWQKPLLWFHVASAGELLQAQPIIDRCSSQGSECLLTYSSINAFRWLEQPDHKENINLLAAEFLPFDLISNVRRLLGLLQPSRLIWVSYDLWPNLVWEAHRQKIPQSLVSGIVHASSLRTVSFARAFFFSFSLCMS